ncbi:nucleotidyl transferase AbiEii/AbiGii toxin family protein [Candidatus Peregrinibacteria bacterium]|nr:nucleotidyl transferase AbiEii/AbiGii toxin family protein [Candidatus Peregrinibacteria bacterium]
MTTADILTASQKEVLRMIAGEKDLSQTFTLSGGTALAAFHLFHRISDDLDFFSTDPVDDLRVRRFAESARQSLGADSMEANRLYDRHLFVLHMKNSGPIKIEFTHYPYPALEQPAIRNGVRVESLRDIATDKLAALLDRFEPKDYYDIHALLDGRHTSLATMRTDLQTKFHITADAVQLGAALARAQRLPILPHLRTPVRKEDIQDFFARLAEDLKPEVMR